MTDTVDIDVTGLVEEAFRKGEADERAAVVAWLRSDEAVYRTQSGLGEEFAALIESGAHRRTEGGE